MKRLFSLLLSMLGILNVMVGEPVESMAACSNEPQSQKSAEGIITNGKTLVAYYSFTNNCKTIATELATQVACDIVEILPAEEGLDYAANNYEIGSSLIAAIRNNPSSASSYPAIKDVYIDVAQYDNIIIVTPLWWSQMAAPMQTFLYHNGAKMASKNVGLIASSASSGISSLVADFKRLIPNGKYMSENLWIKSSQTSNASYMISSWLTNIGFANLSLPTSSMPKLQVTIDGISKEATLVDNSSTHALVEQLQRGSITYEAHDYGDFEKVGALGYSFPQNNEQITTQPGDLILYQGSNLCIYYDENQWDFTRIGKLDNMTQAEIKTFVKAGGANVIVTLSLKETTKVYMIQSNNTQPKSSKRLTKNGQVIINEKYDISGKQI